MSFSPEVPVVLAASAGWDTPAPVNAHQVARRLAERGHRVLFLESTGLRPPAVASGHDWRRIIARLRSFSAGPREVAPGLFVFSPLTLPPVGPPAMRDLSLSVAARLSVRAARELGWRDPILWAFLPTALPLVARLAPRLVVYHCVDDYAANPGVDPAWIAALEQRMLDRADLVFATSPVLGERLRRLRTGPDEVHVVPNVADTALFARALEEHEEPAELRGRPRPRAVFVGNVAAYRIDFTLLRAVVDAGIDLVVIGAVGLGDVAALPPAGRALLADERVIVVAPQPQSALPAYLAHCDVALVPFLVNDHTRASLPLKLWEYLAAGLPVVATDLPNLRTLAAQEASGALHLADSPSSFAAAARVAAAEPLARRPERSALARAHDWSTRMKELCTAVGSALDSRDAARTLHPKHR